MKLATFEAPGQSEPLSGLVQDDRIAAFGGPDGVREALAGGRVPGPSGGAWPLDDVRLLAPIPAPGTIYAIGLNYADHIAEMGNTTPEAPVVFVKLRGSVAPPGGPISCPDVVRRLDYEGEMVIVIGADGQIGGFCIADDVTARDLQKREPQWTRAKGADTFCPFGPWVTTADEISDPGSLGLRTWVNDELRQDSNTSNLVFGCAKLVEFIGETCTLLPGDLILTGTPNGVGQAQDPPTFLRSGDRVRIAIDGLGEIEHAVQ
ncbi:MAG TPA: fumarylacetoacetate hydrolase family protein [Solirubrobacteraceae bacterium]